MAEKTVTNISLEPPTRNTFRVSFEAIDLPNNPVLRLPYNPAQISIEASPQWAAVSIAGSERPRSVWERNNPRKISWSHMLHVGSYTGNTADAFTTETVLLTLEDWATSIVLETQRPTRVRLTLGDARQYDGHIDSFTYSSEIMNEDGFILTGEYSITFVENPE